ncbi:DUF6271 family protein [Actinoplanes sp. TFC3]|uniref:DUF6271 family protein n=1 Tax=Actinoplanes sp. TFC3 TaxID=1710355 RepID=UPI00082AC624|nr:DUF6271 family protein [Actinoplanes sp. TFC3]
MRRVCLTLPTNRECAAVLTQVAAEARYAAEHFGVTVVLLVLDSTAAAPDRERHAAVLRSADVGDGVEVVHLDEGQQRRFLRTVISVSGVAKPDLIADLMLPAAVSYGACTNRAFLIAAALGCESVHRRDSDSGYQIHDGQPVYPIRHELAVLGRRASDVAGQVDEVEAVDPDRPVVLAGASFVGDLSVDIAAIRALNPQVYHDIVSLWAPGDATAEQKRELVEESFRGAGEAVFTGDRSTLTVVDPMRVDMCNIAFSAIQEQVPLPPATDTIGSDYFLFHLIRSAQLPGVLHNRDIVNFHTAERKSDAGLWSYQMRLVKFLLSMPYLHFVYRGMAALGERLTDRDHRIRTPLVAGLVRESSWLSRDENAAKLDSLDRSYRALGGRYTTFAATLAARRDQLLVEARRDMDDFALLIEAWQPLVTAAHATGADW